ncbi:MAG TPA: GldG family protein [Polyangiaceae bacterium]|jgi:ABC-type uncharacterized transport system involved in gliding motility auxiliary subunit
MATQEQKRKAMAQTGLYLAVITAILIAANILAAGMFQRIDVTKAQRHTLSEGSGRLIRSLKGPLQVDAYVQTGLAHLDVFVRDLTDLLKEYQRSGKEKFQYTIIEPNTDELRQRAKDAGLQETAFAAETGEDQAAISQGYMGLVFKYGSEKAVIPYLQPARNEGLEFWISNKVREIRDKADDIKHRIGVVTGKDELKLTDQNLIARQGRQGSPSMKSILEQAFPYYKIEDIDLKGGDQPIDADLAGLVITQPQKEYSEKELRRIDEFLMRGDKALALYVSAVNIKPQDATMMATLDLHGLDKLVSGYGIDIKKNAVFDHGAQFRIPVMTASGAVAWIRHPGLAHVVNDPRFDEKERPLDTSFAGFFRMDEVAFPFPSSLELLPSKQPSDVKLYAVARTTPASSVETGTSVSMKLRDQWSPKPPHESRIIAAVAEGKLKSAFSPNADVKPNERAPKPSRVLVISSSQFLTNPFAYAGNGPEMGPQFQMFGGVGGDQQLQMIAQPYAQKFLTNTILSFKNTLDWMSGDVDLLAASAKILGDPNLSYASIDKPSVSATDDEAAAHKKDEEFRGKRRSLQRQVQWTVTLGAPLAFAFFGIGRWRWRNQRRDQRNA